LQQSEKATKSGLPVLQAMVFNHPEDKLCWHIDDQYYFGDEFLVAPVMNSENKRDVYLPAGIWIDFFSGKIVEGGKWLKNIEVPLDEMPVWVKFGAEIPFYPEHVNSTDDIDFEKVINLKIDNFFKGVFNLSWI